MFLLKYKVFDTAYMNLYSSNMTASPTYKHTHAHTHTHTTKL